MQCLDNNKGMQEPRTRMIFLVLRRFASASCAVLRLLLAASFVGVTSNCAVLLTLSWKPKPSSVIGNRNSNTNTNRSSSSRFILNRVFCFFLLSSTPVSSTPIKRQHEHEHFFLNLGSAPLHHCKTAGRNREKIAAVSLLLLLLSSLFRHSFLWSWNKDGARGRPVAREIWSARPSTRLATSNYS